MIFREPVVDFTGSKENFSTVDLSKRKKIKKKKIFYSNHFINYEKNLIQNKKVSYNNKRTSCYYRHIKSQNLY